MAPSRRSFDSRGGIPPPGRDLLVIAVILVIVDALAAMLLVEAYLPRRRREVLARAPAQLALLARDRRNALVGWVRERVADAELTASLLAAPHAGDPAPQLLDRFLSAYGYESALIIDDSGTVLLRRGFAPEDSAPAVQFARETMKGSGAKIYFRRVGTTPKVFTACSFAPPGGSKKAAVLFVSDPYDYVYPLMTTATVAWRTGETNLIGLEGRWGLALNPYREGTPPPMTYRRPISKEFAATALSSGERSIRYVDRRGNQVIAVVKAIPRTPWVVVAKIDEEEVLAGAVAETWRLGQLLAVLSLIFALAAFVALRSRRVRDLRVAEEQLARLFENSTTGIVIFRVIRDGTGTPVDHEVVDMNPAAEHLFGVTAEAEMGKRTADTPYLRWTAEERAANYEVAETGVAIEYESFKSVVGRWFEVRSF